MLILKADVVSLIMGSDGMINETLEADKIYRRDKNEAYERGYAKGKADVEQHWISVEQDLPKIGEYVLCETTTRYFGKYHVCKFVDKDKWVNKPHFDWDRNGFPHVIAWTRFKPYKG